MIRWIDLLRVAPLAGALALFTGCANEGPAEQAGEDIDNAASEVGDALDPSGPAEETGEAIDDTMNN